MHKPVGYSHLAQVISGQLIFIAGQVALDASGNLVGPGDFQVQAEQVFKNLKAAVEAAGGSALPKMARVPHPTRFSLGGDFDFQIANRIWQSQIDNHSRIPISPNIHA